MDKEKLKEVARSAGHKVANPWVGVLVAIVGLGKAYIEFKQKELATKEAMTLVAGEHDKVAAQLHEATNKVNELLKALGEQQKAAQPEPVAQPAPASQPVAVLTGGMPHVASEAPVPKPRMKKSLRRPVTHLVGEPTAPAPTLDVQPSAPPVSPPAAAPAAAPVATPVPPYVTVQNAQRPVKLYVALPQPLKWQARTPLQLRVSETLKD
jgi:hypothetical protein